MRVSVLIGRVKGGEWECLALPDKDIEAQKAQVKQLINAGGVVGEGRKQKQLVELMRLEKYAKRVRFSPALDAPVV
jgi:hypothetical protein